ncbi:MAG: glycosyltransferase [Planctomycetota bacterium]|jgi:glycosyltransferase involved in cell wall biosynthesis|nr:glycosyltransferase [Planctomycetota bacterium]
MAKHKILHAITTLDRGGAEIQLLEVLSRLDPDRYEIHLAYLKGEGTLRSEFESAGVTVQPFRMFSPLDPLLIRRLTRYMRKQQFDLVHTHLFKADVHATLAARKAKIPYVICGKHNEDPYLERWIPGRVGRRISRKVDRTVVLSQAVERFMIEVGAAQPETTRLVPYGIDLEAFDRSARDTDRAEIRREWDLDEDAFVLGCVARLEPQKAHLDLLEAVARIRPKHPEIKLLLIGDGTLRHPLEARSAQEDLRDAVRFTGVRSDIPRLLAGLDLFVLSSHWEGFGLVLLEAMAARLPIVATSVGAIPEIVVDGETGLLAPPKDPEQLAQSIGELASDRARSRAYGQAGRNRAAQDFTLDQTVSRLTRVYEELLS